MRYALLLALGCGTSALCQRPALTWEGYVDGSATIYIQGKSIDVQGRSTGSVDRPRVRLHQPLPAFAQTIEVRVRKGKGRVEVVEQPARENDHSAVVQIDNRETGPDTYSLDFFWAAKEPASQSGPPPGSKKKSSNFLPQRKLRR